MTTANVADAVAVSLALDPFLSLRALAGYSSLSVRTLREHLTDSVRPLPHYRVGSKILVRVSEFDAWLSAHRQATAPVNVRAIVDEMLRPSHTRQARA